MDPKITNNPDSKDRIVGQYNVKCSDTYTLRVMLEIIGAITAGGSGLVVFDDDGITCTHATGNMKVLVSVKIDKSKLLLYKVEGNRLGASVKAYLRINNLTEILKSATRKEISFIQASYNQDGTVVDMHVIGDNGLDRVPILGPTDNDVFEDVFNKYYANDEPTANLTVPGFGQIISKFKSRRCTRMDFTVNQDGVIVKGIKDVVLSVYHIQNDSTITTDDDPKDSEPDYQVIGGTGGTPGLTIINNDSHVVSVELADNLNWISKISRTSSSNSIISIYLKRECPLVIATTLGTIGKSYYAFSSIA